MAHGDALRDAFAAATRSRFGTALSVVALAAALALPLAAEALLTNLSSLARRAGSAPLLTVYLVPTASANERDALLAAIQRQEGVASARLITREQALSELQAREGVRDLLAGLPGNPLPDSVAVTPAKRQPQSVESLRGDLARLPGVGEVAFDSAWVDRVAAIVRAGELLTAALAVMLATAVVAVTFNTIRLQVLTRAAELDVESLFGATPAYMRRPFLYFGALQSLTAALLAVAAVQAALWGFNRRIGPALELVGLPEGFAPLSVAGAVVALGVAFGLGWLGAWLAVSRHLAPARALP